MLRVLHVIESWGPGGAETVFADLASGLDASRFESTIMLSRDRDWLFEEVARRGIRPIVNHSSTGFDLTYLRRLVQTIRRRGIQLIQSHTFGTSVYAAAAGIICRIPVVCTFHGEPDLGRTARLRRAKYGILARGASRIVSVSRALARDVADAHPFPAEKLAVIHNGVDTERFRPGSSAALRESLGSSNGELVVGAVGNLRRAKGYEVLLAAAAELARRGVPLRFAIVGQASGELYDELTRQAAELQLGDRVRFLGFREDVDTLYRAFDIFALTSHSEGFSLATVQAIASGLPAVATRCGGPEEILTDGVDGLLVPPGSPQALADALERLAADGPLRARLSIAARETAISRFSVDAMLRAYERLYAEVGAVGRAF